MASVFTRISHQQSVQQLPWPSKSPDFNVISGMSLTNVAASSSETAAAALGSGMEKHPTGINTQLRSVNETELPASHWNKRWSHKVLVGQSCVL